MDDVPESVREELDFILVSHVDEVLKHALNGSVNL
ncbi:S16 family serine protease [Streptococcus hyovaginalis]